MTDRLYLNPDVLLHHARGIWLASNPRVRCHVELDAVAMRALAEAAAGQAESDWMAALAEAGGADFTQRAMGAVGLHADHSGFAEASGKPVHGVALLALLRQRRILIALGDEAGDLLRPLVSALDRDSLGTFHQRVGQHWLWQRQREPWRAWQNQKFSEDGLTLLPGAYHDIQAPFFDAYFTPERLSGKRVLDFGCGNGYFSARMAEVGAEVLALDNSAELLTLARANHGQRSRLRFVETVSFEDVLALCAAEPAGSFDFIYLQDTLLLLLHPEAGEPAPQLPEVFRALRRLLRAGGRLCAMEPNASFWLANRYGDPARPYAVVTEYFQPLFNVVPSLEQLIAFMAEAGFALSDYRHPRATQAEAGYPGEFPIWDFFVFAPCPSGGEA
ncbi:MAG: class I SAM-dependent methyltransferase [Pseudomonadota bacterium]|nr:class I SAM-dependent methyltransferase [Pseudomonadota bacterium]